MSFPGRLSSVVCLRPFVCPSVYKIFTFSSSSSEPLHGPISTKFVTKHPLVQGIQVCSNEGPRSFLNGDIYGSSSSKFRKKHPWVKGTLGFTNKDHLFLKKEIMVFFFNFSLSRDIIMISSQLCSDVFIGLNCMVSHVSDVTHGTLVVQF